MTDSQGTFHAMTNLEVGAIENSSVSCSVVRSAMIGSHTSRDSSPQAVYWSRDENEAASSAATGCRKLSLIHTSTIMNTVLSPGNVYMHSTV
ncbi:hypothetical protein BaRGS_00000988 [Batillaria attramentaria]|uniref:Uncharacterized protein n=1 Tax=Batillaria attramentaria TaxID=370345 RepID=A0ABD0M9V8_9CAEN